MVEIDENFVRSSLSEMDRNDILSRRKELYEQLHPQVKHGGDRRSEEIKRTNCPFEIDRPKSFVEDTAEKLHLSPKTIQRRIRISRAITPEAKSVIRSAEEKFSQDEELKLTHVDAAHQEEAAQQYLAGKIRSIGDYTPDNPGVTDEKSEDEPQEDGTMPIKPETPRAEESTHSAAVETVSVPSLPQPETENHDVSALEPPISSGKGVKEAERQQSGHTDSPEKSDSPAIVARDAPKAAKTESPPPKEKSRRAPTIKEIVADLKDADKERPCTPDIFMMEFGKFIEGLIDHIEWFEMPDYTGVFSELTEEQYQTLYEKQKSVRSSMDKFMKLVRRKMKK